MKAMVLAAGLGTRLRPHTDRLPKPLFPVLGVPVVRWVLARLRAAGVDHVVLNLHHRPADIVRALGNGREFGVDMTYSEEPFILGTGGALWAVRSSFEAEEDFIVHNGDVFACWDLGGLVELRRRTGDEALLALADPSGSLDMPEARLVEEREGWVVGIRGVPRDLGGRKYVFSGVSVLTPGFVGRLPQGEVSCLVSDGVLPALEGGGRVGAAVMRGVFHDIGTPKRYLALQWELLPQAPAMFEDAGMPPPVVDRDGVMTLGSPSIRPGARIEPPALVCSGAVVEGGATVGPRAVVCEGARVEAGALVRDAVVFPGVLVRGPVEGIVSGGVRPGPAR